MNDHLSSQRWMEWFLLQSQEHAFIILDREGRVLDWQGAAQQLLGFSLDEIRGHSLGELFTSADASQGLDALELDMARTHGCAEDDRWHVRKDGGQVWMDGALQAVRGDGGELVGFVKVLRDRTDLRMQLERLENELASMQSALDRTHSFLRSLGHELRNSLAPIYNAAVILRMVSDDARAARPLAILDEQLKVMRKMAEDLMELTRLQTGQMRLELSDEDMCAQLADVRDGLQGAAADKRIDLVLVLPGAVLPVRIDRSRMWQALHNIVANAIKYTAPGGTVWLHATREGDEIVAKIIDTGIGIGADALPSIFDLFARSSTARAQDATGLGVGLAVVKQIVELHHGFVVARSEGEGKGSEFAIRLPVASSWKAAQESAHPDPG